MQDFPSPHNLSNAELARYAQMYVDRKESLPLSWQQELIRRLQNALDFADDFR
jgi:hypothetical protein